MGKKFIPLVVLAWMFVALPAFAQEIIRDFSVEAELGADRGLTVTETIRYDFGGGFRHGIFRLIPEVYQRNGAHYRLHFTLLQALMDGGAVPATVTDRDGNWEMRLGDPNQTLTSRHTYQIRYQTERAINDVNGRAELYWNVIGSLWPVPIEAASFRLHAPALPEATACFVGMFGAQEASCAMAEQETGWVVRAERPLRPYEDLTIVAAFPHTVIPARSPGEVLWQFVVDNLWALLPFGTFFLMLGIWWKWGKEPRGRGVIIPVYEEPEALAPALMSALLEQHVSLHAITATILDLARRGYLSVKIEENGRISFVRQRAPDAELLGYERMLLDALFKKGTQTERSLQDLKGTFWEPMQHACQELCQELVRRGFFGRSPLVARAPWILIAGMLAIGGFLAGGLFIISCGLSALIIFAFGWQMPQMTKRGALMAEACEGFKRFLSVTEKQRLAFTDAPERRPEQFARFLPAAVAFGVEHRWAERFAGLELPPPAYMSGPWTTWNAIAFSQAVSTLHTQASSSMYHAPSSAGMGRSGFSGGGAGGGFGGGGGGSW